MERLRDQVVPSLEALIAVALQRDAAQADAVETAALRRSDELKTALLQATSHDLRTPVTAILAAAHALRARSVTEEERGELSAAVVEEAERLSALIDKLLDLSRLQSGRAEPRRDWISLEEVVLAARDDAPGARSTCGISIDPDVPPIRADAAQLERAFANLLENAWRYSDGLPVSVHVRRAGTRVVVRVVDQGPGSAGPSRRGSSSRSTAARRPRSSAGPGRGWGSRSPRGSSRPTAGRSRSTRSPARARAS